MISWFKNLFNSNDKTEYVYFYFLKPEFFDIKLNIRTDLMVRINKDIKKNKKEVKDWEIYTEKDSDESLVLFSTSLLSNKYLQPILLEIYAFIKKGKDFSIIKYPKEEISISFKDKKTNETKPIIIHKYKVEC